MPGKWQCGYFKASTYTLGKSYHVHLKKGYNYKKVLCDPQKRAHAHTQAATR